MWSRRQFLARGTGLVGLAAGANALLAVNRNNLPDGSASRGMINAAADEAIQRGLAYLARGQSRDGSLGTGPLAGNVAVTSLAALAFMSGGHLPGRNRYGENVTGALTHVLSQTTATRFGLYLCSNRGFRAGLHERMYERMYGHGFATLFLGEVYGMVQDSALRKRLRDVLRGAVQLIVKTQNHEGGWRYEPQPDDSDISVTICQIMALRSARNAGISVPKTTVKNCIEYVKGCQNLRRAGDANALQDGGFRYTKRFFSPSGFARSAAGVVALHSAGVYKGPEVDAGLKYLNTFRPGSANQNRRDNDRDWRDMQTYYFYGHYYAAQAMWTAGGKYWREWYPAIRDELLNPSMGRKRDDHWTDRFCEHYGTAMALIILQIPNNYLPILQK